MSPKIFLSHASADKATADLIATEIKNAGGDVWYDEWNLEAGDSIKEQMEKALTSSDYIVVLLSPSAIKSQWVRHEWNYALNRELKQRNVSVLPVMIEECEIPPLMADSGYLDLTKDPERGISTLVERLEHAREIDFGMLDSDRFGDLIAELLDVLGFSDIRREKRIGSLQVDFQADYKTHDPFDGDIEDRWIIEAKLYEEKRFSIAALHQIISYLISLPRKYRGLLITNGHLTSQARDFLRGWSDRVQLRVIDGLELRSLLLKHPQLVDKYFDHTKPK